MSEFHAVQGITKLLEAKVKEMVSSAQKRAAGQADAQMLPLIRLRVDYTGFSTINAQRFGQQFVGKVANPHDLLLFQKAPARKPKVHGPSTWNSMALAPWPQCFLVLHRLFISPVSDSVHASAT